LRAQYDVTLQSTLTDTIVAVQRALQWVNTRVGILTLGRVDGAPDADGRLLIGTDLAQLRKNQGHSPLCAIIHLKRLIHGEGYFKR